MIAAVTGGKGGVGKSTVALNLANELDGVAVDCDLVGGTLPRGTGPTIHDVLAGRIDATAAVHDAGSTAVVPSGRTLEGARASDFEELSDAVDALHRQYSWVVLDCPPGLARDVGVALHVATVAVIVTTPSTASFDSARQSRELAADLDTPVVAVVLNRADDHDDSLVHTLESELTAPVTELPSRLEVNQAQTDGEAVRERYAESPAVDRFESIATLLEESKDRLEERPGR